jgi:ATP-dependent RNA helicase DDX35
MQRAKEVHKHLEIMLKRSNPNNMAFASCGSDYKSIRQCLVSGYFANAARMGPDGKYCTLRGNAKVSVHPSSVLAHFGTPPEWVIYNEIVQSQEPQMRDISKVEPLWLHEFASHYYQLSNMPI